MNEKEAGKLDASVTKQIESIAKRMSRTINGYSGEIQKFVGNIDFKSLQNKMQGIEKVAEKTGKRIGSIKYDDKNIANYINAFTKTMDLHPRMKTADKMQLANSKIENQDFYMKNKMNTPEDKKTKFKITGYSTGEYENIAPSANSLNLWDTLKNKIEQIKPSIQQLKQTLSGVGNNDKELGSFKQKIEQVKPSISNIKNSFNGLPKITQNITNNIKGMGSGLKNGLRQILRYAGALFSLQSIYSTLSGAAHTWLSSQNAEAKQLNANIEYMKYAMGSALAPIIQFITNLVYQLMKAIQSVAYAMTGVNIFAKASAGAFKSAQKSAKDTSKSLSSIHSEINNVGDKGNNGSENSSPNIGDLSKLNPTNSLVDAIKNGNWYEVGATIGQKLNNAMNNIDWTKIQNTARKIGTGIAQTLNGFIATTDWSQVGNTFAQGINTIIYFGYNFVTTFDWKQFGKAIGDSINGFFNNIDWATAGQTLSEGIKGAFSTIYTALETIDWQQLAKDAEQFVSNIDWSGITQAFFRGLGAALGGLSAFLGTLISDAFNGIGQYFNEKIEECGGDITRGIFNGIVDAISGIGQWINDNIFVPFIDGFKNAFGIHSPSTVMMEMGGYIIDGLKNGLLGIWDKVKQPFVDFKNNVTSKFTEIKSNISNWSSNTKTTISNWGNDVKNKISSAWSNASQNVNNSVNSLKNNIVTGLNSAKSTVSDWGGNIKNTFSNLARDASSWGRDLVDNMTSGIKNNIYKISNAANSIAGKINDYLHFTEPDVGPLSNFHTYMPDMIDLMVSGIRDNTSKVKNEIENLAGTMSYTINTDGIGDIPQTNTKIEPVKVQSQNLLETLEDILAGQSNNGQPLHVTIQYLGKEIFDDTIDYINSKTRRTGRNTIVTVGD